MVLGPLILVSPRLPTTTTSPPWYLAGPLMSGCVFGSKFPRALTVPLPPSLTKVEEGLVRKIPGLFPGGHCRESFTNLQTGKDRLLNWLGFWAGIVAGRGESNWEGEVYLFQMLSPPKARAGLGGGEGPLKDWCWIHRVLREESRTPEAGTKPKTSLLGALAPGKTPRIQLMSLVPPKQRGEM